ncbi:histidine kinase dimerization/phospho-acceptor domain-containing protein, partial [Paenibacillus sp. 598K]|uniref:histidine kinase dimerization/phospho-acceptor domain-containing protein n=1 Tax=Paenibacillus sp. 598K TaxID=1117987 RepID=UPI002739655D
TPLNSILLMSELIKDAEEEECAKNAKAATQIHEAGTELLRIIEDILDLSKLEAGKMEPVSELVSPQDLGQLVAYQHQELVTHKKGLQIVLEHAPETPEAIMTDMFRLNQLLRLLLFQVSAYAEEGSILLRIEPDQDRNSILFRIASCHAVLPQAHRELLQEAISTDRPELLQAVGSGG